VIEIEIVSLKRICNENETSLIDPKTASTNSVSPAKEKVSILSSKRDKNETPEKAISEIGQKIKLRLNGPTKTRESFRDLKTCEYLRSRPSETKTAINECIEYMASLNTVNSDLRKVEKNINDHTRMILKVVNAGESHGHLHRIMTSKITSSEMEAPKYYLFKDHKEKESWRPVVFGCSSNTLGFSNLISDIVKLLAVRIYYPD